MQCQAFLVVALAALAGSAAGLDHSDFSGTWKMDTGRSGAANQAVPVEASTVLIELTELGLTVETTRTDQGIPTAFHEILNLKLDGSETTSLGDHGAAVRAKAHWEGSKLVVETVRNIHEATVTTLQAFTLSADAKAMTVDKTLSVQHGYEGTTGSNTGRGTETYARVSK